MNFIVPPLFFFSSALFPVPDLPGAVRLVVQLNPLSYGVDGLRGVLTSGFVFGVATDFAVLGGLAAILLARSAGHCWSPAGWPFMSGGHGRQLDEGIVAQRRDGFQRHVAGTLHGPFVVLLQEDGTDEPDDDLVIGEDADDLSTTLDLAVHALDRIDRVQLRAVRCREAHIGEHVALCLIHQLGELLDPGLQLWLKGLSRLHHIAPNIRRPTTNGLQTSIPLRTTYNVAPAYIPRATTSVAPTFLSIAVCFFLYRTITDDRINVSMKLKIICKHDICARQQHQSRNEKNTPHSLLP